MVKFNKVKERFIFLSPTVQAGWEDESEITDFNLTKVLGKGAFGRVSKAVHKKSQLIYAIKEINKKNLKDNGMVEQVANEVKIMYTLNDPNIIKLYNHFEDETNIYLIQEFAVGGQLYQLLWKQPGKRFQEKKAAQYIYQLCQALTKCHNIGIIHRDIKPENLLIDGKGNLKLADFGWSNFLKPNANDIRDTFCGTLDYLAPEMLEQSHKHDFNVDIWAVGVLTYELLTGASPFSPKEQQFNANYVDLMTRKNIKQLNYQFPSNFPPLALGLVKAILQKEPSDRLQLPDIMGHSWIVQQCSDLIKEEVKSIEKKEIVQIAELDEFTKECKAIFTQDEIYNYTRKDSIVNKKFDEKDKLNPNFDKTGGSDTSVTNLIFQQVSGNSDSSDLKQNIVNQLQGKIIELEKKLNLMGLENSKKAKEIEILKNELNNNQLSFFEGDQDELKKQLSQEKEKYQKLKVENDYQWGKLMDSEKKVRELQIQAEQVQGGGSIEQYQKMIEYKNLYENVQSQLAQFKGGQCISQQPNQNSNIDQLIQQMKQEQQVKPPTKQNKHF